VRPSEYLEFTEWLALGWTARLVDEVDERGAQVICAEWLGEVPLDEAKAVVREQFTGHPFPPSPLQVLEGWQARRAGLSDDPELIAGLWLQEAWQAVRKYGTYRSPEFSDPAIRACIDHAAGSWLEWCLTPTGGPGGDGEPFVRNVKPERERDFRAAAVKMIRHRRRTGDALPELVARRQEALGRSVSLQRASFELPAAGSGGVAVPTTGEAVPTTSEDVEAVAGELAAREQDREQREQRKAEARARLAEMDRTGDS
jgi:hypothetical protein